MRAGFLAPPEALDALNTFGFDLIVPCLATNASDRKVTAIQNKRPPEDRPRRDWKQLGRSRGAGVSAYSEGRGPFGCGEAGLRPWTRHGSSCAF